MSHAGRRGGNPQGKEDLARRLEFIGIDAAQTRRLGALRPLLAQASDALVAGFYRHLLSSPETRDLLKDRERRDRLLEEQREYLLGLASTSLDEEYAEERRRMGEVHEEAGLSPGWFLAAYAQHFSSLAFLIEDAVDGDVGEFRSLLVALFRRLVLDAQLALEAQVERRERRLAYLNEELARMLRELEPRGPSR